jgi:gamma-glutamyltranspeptidase/glutathione hydrolase
LPAEDRIVGMNASGRAPGRAEIGHYHRLGLEAVPARGLLSATVPGALHGWAQAVERYGRLSLSEVMEDAIYYAERGFPVTEVIAGEWGNAEDLLRFEKATASTYLPGGRAPRPGEVFANRDLARTFRKIAEQGVESFYGGEVCDAILDFSDKHDGLFSRRDFEDHRTTWVEPIATDYRGWTVYELPPNGQGLTALEVLNILEGYDLADLGHNSAEYLHLLAEAKKIAFQDRDTYITDPEFEEVPVDRLISKEYARQCRSGIDRSRARRMGPASVGSETVYVAAVDEDRNAVSFISSIFMHFGSGVTVDGTGIVLQNRGHSFSLDPRHANHLAPNKRPLHTIIPGMVFRDGRFALAFGVMGGDMQPQGHVQFLVNLIDFHMNLQEAVDAPRLRHVCEDVVYLEDGITDQVAAALEKKGHRIRRGEPVNQVGGAQAVYFDREQGVLLGASDRRKDGCAIGY